MIEGFEFDRDGDIARLTFARPAKKNAVTHAMWSAIPGVVDEVEADPAVKVLVLTGAGADFSAGADISEFGDLRSSAEGAMAYDKVVDGAVRALSGMRKPSIAMIRGNCIGGGCQISVACDFRFAEPSARFGITPAKLGIVYDFRSTHQLVSLVGPAHARYFLLSGQLIDAARAREIGLLNDIFDPGALEDGVREFANVLCARSQASIRGMNAIIGKIQAGQDADDAEIAAIRSAAIRGEDYAEGVAAFLERRTPDFRYR
ncbi:enoyl-CoA hydratase/isomerase family protein [Amycolatopsis minnesotensis]|uniref:Enoyl-CoA hydratase-related protein n=1 Tax=Amycolatopsis minnesotensis TaxID=337894 RepID=A0ABP5DFB9_9PSEU